MWGRISRALQASYANNQPFYQLGFILGIGGLIIALVVAGGWWSQREPARVASEDPLLFQHDEDRMRPASLRRLVENIYEAHGGRGALESMNSFIRHGTLFSDAGEQAVVYSYKRPDKLSYTIDGDAFTLRITFDGHVGWTQIVNSRGQRREALLSAEESEFIRKSTRMIDSITAFLSDTQALEWVDDAEVSETPCYVLLWRGVGMGEVRLYFAKDSLMLKKRQRLDETVLVDGSPENVAVIYADFRRISGTFFAFEETVYRQNKKLNRLVIDNWQINPGIMDRYFTAPVELTNQNE